jgi:hypothetical protein
MLLDVANRKAGSRYFCGRRHARDSTADDENVENVDGPMMPHGPVTARSDDVALASVNLLSFGNLAAGIAVVKGSRSSFHYIDRAVNRVWPSLHRK